jgi:AraC-like DNA-binding protein/mannose-6-phosphate isomerase-like protein (cupin superfamily)
MMAQTSYGKPWHQHERLDNIFQFRVIKSLGRIFPPHWHEPVEILYVDSGRMSFSLGTGIYDLNEGDIIAVNPGEVHGCVDVTKDLSFIAFQIGLDFFDTSLVDFQNEYFKQDTFGKSPIIRADADSLVYCRLKEIFFSITKEYFLKEKGYEIAIKSKIYEFILVFIREIHSGKQEVFNSDIEKNRYYNRILERILSYINTYTDESDLTLEKAAQIASLSKFYFTRFFREKTGQTFHAYLSHLRIKKAEECLADSDMTISDIVRLCGIANKKTFYRLFKAYTGCSPVEYRKKNSPKI